MLSVKFIGRKDLKPGLYRDSPNLYLQVNERGTKSWICRYMILGRARKMGFGSAGSCQAGRCAQDGLYEARLKVLEGVDPYRGPQREKGFPGRSERQGDNIRAVRERLHRGAPARMEKSEAREAVAGIAGELCLSGNRQVACCP
jgi:hypothetical protein